jgi:hypothetical protein
VHISLSGRLWNFKLVVQKKNTLNWLEASSNPNFENLKAALYANCTCMHFRYNMGTICLLIFQKTTIDRVILI